MQTPSESHLTPAFITLCTASPAGSGTGYRRPQVSTGAYLDRKAKLFCILYVGSRYQALEGGRGGLGLPRHVLQINVHVGFPAVTKLNMLKFLIPFSMFISIL